jgi:regulator of protease activity HflC (stomatin/prohibitin superfamily)
MKRSAFVTAALAASLFALGACDMIPAYRVYNARKTGEAELAQADGNRQIKVQEAKAAYESADYLAKAEIRKAEGVAQANKIMAASLGGPEGYLRWKYIEMLQEQKGSQVIYVPTEATLPILEAGRRPTTGAGDAK